jgi:hypothetical protein
MHRRIPCAVANDEKIVEGHNHFLDKTRFIRKLVETLKDKYENHQHCH